MSSAVLRQILHLSWPVLVAQLAHISMAVTDTVLVGRYATDDLAGIAIGSSLHVTISLALVGVLQSLSPVVAHLHGAQRDEEVARAVRQGVWLALLLGLIGFLILRNPRLLVAWSAPNAEVEAIAVGYLQLSAWALPGQMLYRAFYAFAAAVGRPRPVMAVSAAGALLHVPLSWALIYGKWGEPMGAAGAALSLVAVAWAWCACALGYLAASPFFRRYRLFAAWEPPRAKALGEMLRIGLPMGFSNLVEVSAFTLIALFVAPLGAEVAAGHRIALNVASTCYMIPLSLGYSLSVLVGHAAGAQDWARARATAYTGLVFGAAVAAVIALAVTALAPSLVAAYTEDPAVQRIALGLMGYAALLHFFDATQTAAAFSLRGYKVTLGPMLIHVAAFWGVGLAGGYWLAFQLVPPLGVAGFWTASVASLVVATVLVGGLLRSVSRAAN